MFLLDKILTPFLNSLSAALVLMVLAIVLLLLRRTRPALGVLLVATAGLYLGATPAVSRWLAGWLEQQYPPPAMASTPAADVIIVLGGSTGPALPPRQAPELNEHADRLMHAADLYKAGKAPVVLVSGGNWLDPSVGSAEANDMADVLGRFGVPVSAMLLETASVDTRQNAVLSVDLMRQRHFRTALLVTSAVHMPRAMAAFRQAGIDPIASETDFVSVSSGDWPVLDWLPSAGALGDSEMALREIAGFIYYRVRGWV